MAGISDKALKTQYAENKYRYNKGSELQNKEFSDGSGLEMYDAVHRMYDPQIGRFGQVDPIADAAYENSPYSFANNNPLTFSDPLGLISDSSHPQELAPVTVTAQRRVPSEFSSYINFPNGQPGTIASFKDWPYSFHDQKDDLVHNWEYGLGATNRIYLPKHPMTLRLRNATGVKEAKKLFYKKYLSDYKKGLSLVGANLLGYQAQFGLGGIISAGPDIVEQFVGGFLLDIRVDEKGENLMFILSNTTGRYSAYCHMASDIQRSPSGLTGEGNLNQVYIWKERISSAGFDYAEDDGLSEFLSTWPGAK